MVPNCMMAFILLLHSSYNYNIMRLQAFSRVAAQQPGGLQGGKKRERIAEVWAENFTQELSSLSQLLDKFPHLSIVLLALT